MPRAICRCGQTLNTPESGTGRIICPQCGSRVRIRQPVREVSDDGYIRFFCPCGRRLKVSAEDPPVHGRCPDCGRVVPVPSTADVATVRDRPPGHPETPTEELGIEDLARLDEWTRRHLARADDDTDEPTSPTLPTGPPAARMEYGLRVCPQCGRPVHLNADACRDCGVPVPRR